MGKKNETATLLLFAVLLGVAFGKAIIPCSWTLYKQCDSRWASHELGTGSDTICEAGCAMSDVSMILASRKESVGGKTSDPLTLNDWLDKNGGFADGDLIVWDAVAKLGSVHVLADVSSLSRDDLKGHIAKCHGVVANVRDGSHWVLVTGYDSSNEDTFYVNDPGFNQDSYDYTTMLRFVV